MCSAIVEDQLRQGERRGERGERAHLEFGAKFPTGLGAHRSLQWIIAPRTSPAFTRGGKHKMSINFNKCHRFTDDGVVSSHESRDVAGAMALYYKTTRLYK